MLQVDDELKKIKPKDPKLMTARQRAMLERKTDKDGTEQLLSLPSGIAFSSNVILKVNFHFGVFLN